MREEWLIFKDKQSGRELCAYALRGTFEGEEQATRELLSHEKGIPAERIEVTIESRG